MDCTVTLLNDFLKEVIKNNTRCKTCELNHNGICFFAYKCVVNDFIHYTKYINKNEFVEKEKKMKITVTFTIEEPAMKEFLENSSVIAYYEKLAEKDFSLDNLDEDALLDIAFEYFDDLYEYTDAPEWKIIKESN